MRLELCEMEGGGGAIVTVEGEVGFSEVQALKMKLDQALKVKGKGLAVDLSGVNFIASDGLGVLIRTQAHAAKEGKGFALVQPPARIMELLTKTQLTRIFTICPTLEEALIAAQGP